MRKLTKRFVSALLSVCMLSGVWSPGLIAHAQDEIPKSPAVAFNFEGDTLGQTPKNIEVSGVTQKSTIKVVSNPSAEGGKALLIEDADTENLALKAVASFADKTDTVTVAFKLMLGTETDDYIINLLQDGDDMGNRGPRLLARDGSLRYINGSGNWVTFNSDYAVDTWYSFLIVANIVNDTYDLYVDGAKIVVGAAFESAVTKLKKLQFTTTGKLEGKMYIDDIAVPDPIKDETMAEDIEKYIPEYISEQLLADGKSSTYLAFPTILKLSDEKVLVAYKATTAHMDVEADLDLIVYNPTTKQVISKTTIDGTVGEAAQNPELMQMPNGDLVIYLDVQRITSSGQQRYGIKEIRSTDGGVSWKTLASDGTYKSVSQVAKRDYKPLQDDKGIVYGYNFDDVTVDGTVYMLAMTFADFAANPGRSVHIIKSSDNGATWTHVKNLTTTFGINFNESTLEAYDGGFIVNCRKDTDGKKGVTYRTDANFNVLKQEDYSDYADFLKTTHRPKMFVENGKYYLMGRNVLDTATTLCLYEIDPVTLVPLKYIELKRLTGYNYANSFYAEYYLQERNGITYFNVITYEDTRHNGYPDIVRYEYVWEELLTHTPMMPIQWPSNAVSIVNKTSNSADVVFKAASDNKFIKKYGFSLNGKITATIDFEEIKEVTGTLTGAKTNHSGQGEYYIAMPKNIPEGMKLPVIIAVHGSGRGAMDYKNTPFYTEQKNIALANGYIFAAISNGPDTWGLDDGLYNLNLFYDYLIDNYPIQQKAALWATSAGGTLANRMVKEHPENVSFVLGTFPVYDLVSGFSLNSCKTAWGTSDLATFKNLIAGKNPADFPDALKNHDYYIAHGSADAAVLLTENSQKMVADVGSNIHLEVIEGGVHGTSNYDFYGDIIAQAFAEHPAVYTYTLTGLTSQTDYSLYISAYNADDFVADSNTVSFETLSSSEGGDPIVTPEHFLICLIYGHSYADATCTAPKTCTICGATEGESAEHIYDSDDDADCNACGFIREVYKLNFSGASLSLENNLTINFKADKNAMDKAGYTSPVATFVFNNLTTTVIGVDNGKGQYVFTFKNITPDKLGEIINATLSAQKDGETVTSAKAIEYSVKNYCYNMLEKYANKNDDASVAFKALLVDLLNYGSATQVYVDPNADSLVSNALTDEQKNYATGDITLDSKGALIGNEGSVVWKSGALVLEDIVVLKYKFTATSVEGLKVKISNGNGKEWTVDKFHRIANGEWCIYFNGLYSHELRTQLYLTVYDADGNQVSNTLNYGIDTYASRMKNDTTISGLSDMLVSLMKYGDSAARYKEIPE